ncbi:uncharacterized protein Z518_01987 [Rhinocladiella mackenziei CBS 650.93]|uniref:Rhinocladiella mackenziei CBS 650.93 unplaced genomic scaffold supercont1.2, whole genome shotgun sequence n=1 Tax=Rhinocladiella mackenziei CBS 650.93 TaxID=1442369 RepID=A0A0D2IND3_9EURO|nr:uncharacterized protein Z518_01987 [Rhinocladiella mackenziei CBS 650.93]KIX07334.1 hypothetical protein Z518_01987 [Rhinocladiella mackenziei CBS 650.93]
MNPTDYHVGWICALPIEEAAVLDMLDEQYHHTVQQAKHDQNNYILGRIGAHNVAIACLPRGVKGHTSATVVATQMRFTFSSIRFGLLVGVGGGVPTAQHDIRLGDVVVSSPTGKDGGVVQYDFGKTFHQGHFVRTGSLNRPPDVLLNAVSSLEARHASQGSQTGAILGAILREVMLRNPSRESACTYLGSDKDELFESSYVHPDADSASCDACDRRYLIRRFGRSRNDPVIHYGLIASGNQVIRDAIMRDQLSGELDILCFEMEAAGLMDNFPCLVIRGICDYSDSHKNKRWQEYAAATAASYAKELLSVIAPAPSFEMKDPNFGCDFGPRASWHFGRAQGFQSLWFREMGARRDNIGRAADGTCSWLENDWYYREWTRQNHGLLWITGNPGAGKSVLLDTLVSTIEREAADTDLIVASFFVHGRGSQMQRTSIGLYRSILHQILSKAKPLLSKFSKIFLSKQENQGEYGQAWTWHEKEILEFLNSRVKRYTSTCPIRLFVDALDECGEEAARNSRLSFGN